MLWRGWGCRKLTLVIIALILQEKMSCWNNQAADRGSFANFHPRFHCKPFLLLVLVVNSSFLWIVLVAPEWYCSYLLKSHKVQTIAEILVWASDKDMRAPTCHLCLNKTYYLIYYYSTRRKRAIVLQLFWIHWSKKSLVLHDKFV